MNKPQAVLRLLDDSDVASVERAVSEMRSGRPVLLESPGGDVILVGVEALDPRLTDRLDGIAAGGARLVLPAARLRRLGLDRKDAGSFALPVIDAARIEALALRLDAKADAPVSASRDADRAALELAALSLILPALVVVPLGAAARVDALAAVTSEAISKYRRAAVTGLHMVSRAPVPLETAPTEFVVFRGGEGLRDQVAIIVGTPDFEQPVPVRLHSACLTGDLFGSLKCDCGDQLRGTVRWMAENGGGVLLYLDQEGRGNGLANKIRAYKLQSQGWDTYDADEVLGFDLDQRRFDFAAEMLRQLGVKRVKLLTNNPEKIGAVKRAGIEVVSHERVIGRPTQENVHYLASKRDRAGHLIDVEALRARLTVTD
jgi:GTP cyclohydrolase II